MVIFLLNYMAMPVSSRQLHVAIEQFFHWIHLLLAILRAKFLLMEVRFYFVLDRAKLGAHATAYLDFYSDPSSIYRWTVAHGFT